MKKIMIVEDDAGIQDSASLIFRQSDYEVTVFKDGRLLLAGQFEMPDIFLIDKQLPGVDGLELCRHLKQQAPTKHIPVIIMSASPQVSNMAAQAGAEGFIEKPFTIADMRALVKKHTE